MTVYYFPRRQGFTSVPSQGGSSLGMARHHSSIRHYTLGEFAREQETSHRHTLRQHLRQEKLNARKMKVGLPVYLRGGGIDQWIKGMSQSISPCVPRGLVLDQVHSIFAYDVLQTVMHLEKIKRMFFE